jgi:hypothetical protein
MKLDRIKMPGKRKGRGKGSGLGKTAGYGHKGQLARKAKTKNVGPFLSKFYPKVGGYKGANNKRERIFAINATSVEEKLKQYGEIDQKDKGLFIDFLRYVFDIPFYYRRIRIIGDVNNRFDEFNKALRIPGASTLPEDKREGYYRNRKRNDFL